jgi:hypothetical protein
MLYALYAGHPWARIVTLIFTVYALIRSAATIAIYAALAARTRPAPWSSIPLLAASVVTSLVVCALLLSPSARQWYEAKRS